MIEENLGDALFFHFEKLGLKFNFKEQVSCGILERMNSRTFAQKGLDEVIEPLPSLEIIIY